MENEAITQLSNEEKTVLILKLLAENAELKARVAELEASQNKPRKTAKNSSKPASKEPKANQEEKQQKKRGPKVGHKGTSRKRSVPDVTREWRVETCADCGAEMNEVEQREIGRSQMIEIPVIILPVVMEMVLYEGRCPCCGKVQRASYPEGWDPKRSFGPNVEALVTYLRQVHHLSYARLESIMKAIFQLSLSQGAIDNLLRRVGKELEPAAERLKRLIRGSPVVGSDETGARVQGKNWWEWVFQTPLASYHVIRPSRGSQVIDEIMEDHCVDVWVADLSSAQRRGARLHAAQFAMCHAHQLRDLQYAIDAGDTFFAHAFIQLLIAAKTWSEHRERFTPEEWTRLVARIHQTCDELLTLPVKTPESQNLQRRYRELRDAIFVFLDNPDVPFDNNASERALRNSVIHRKVTGGFRSDHGPITFGIVTSIAQTARKNNLDILDTLRFLLPPSPLSLIPQGE
jgi:transposase